MKVNKFFSILIILVAFVGLYLLKDQGPLVRLGYSSLGLIWLVKISALFFEGKKFESKFGLVSLLFLWPGVSSDGFRVREKKIVDDASHRFFENWITFILGFLLLSFCIYWGRGTNTYINYLSLFSILLIIHLGLVDVLGSLLMLIGFRPKRMFDRPFLAKSLREFWSHRWNKAFVEMNKVFFVTPLKGKVNSNYLVFFIFILSGVLHEIAISYSAGIAYGGPLFYFVIQGLGFLAERKYKIGRVGTLLVVLLPIPILFPPSFVNLYFGMLAEFIFRLFEGVDRSNLVSGLFLLGGCMQACVLFASVQVPSKLNWKNDLSQLTQFNRKVFWTYGGYIFGIILFMSVTSVLLGFQSSHDLGAMIWIIFISLFWGARVLVDAFYYHHEDWPVGPEFVIGHICLTTLFVSLVLIYLNLIFLVI